MEIVVTAQIRNGLLWKAAQKCGSQSALARYLDVRPTTVCDWLNFKAMPRYRDDNITPENQAKYEKWDELLVQLIGYGLPEIFPEEMFTHREALYKRRRMEAFVEMPVNELAAAGAVRQIAASPFESLLEGESSDKIHDLLATLAPREAKVLILRFGLGGENEHTLEEVAQDLNVTRERIRQIEAKALRKLRHPQRSKHLKEILGVDRCGCRSLNYCKSEVRCWITLQQGKVIHRMGCPERQEPPRPAKICEWCKNTPITASPA